MIKGKKSVFFYTLIFIFLIYSTSVYAVGITIPLGFQFNVNTGTLNVSGNISNFGIMQLSTGSITLDGNWTNSGVFISGAGTVTFKAVTGTQTLTCGGISDNEDFYSIHHSGSGTLQNLDALVIKNDFINSSGIWDAHGQNITIYGGFLNSATFIHNNNTVYFRGSSQSEITGANIFYNFSVDTNPDGAKTIRFEAGVEQIVINSLTLMGHAGKVLTIYSTIEGTQAYLTLEADGDQTMDYLNVHDNSAENGQTLAAGPNSVLTNTTNWTSKIISIVLRDATDTGNYDTWALGSGKGLDTVYIMNGIECVLVKDNGNVAEDFSISANSSYWTLASSTGQDQCVLMGLFNGNSTPVMGDFSTSNDLITEVQVWATQNAGEGKFEGIHCGDNVPSHTGEKLYIYLKTPSSLTQGEQENITVTIGVREHGG